MLLEEDLSESILIKFNKFFLSNLMKDEETDVCVRIVTSGRILSMPTSMKSTRDVVCLYLFI
jgi:hypothetical protein